MAVGGDGGDDDAREEDFSSTNAQGLRQQRADGTYKVQRQAHLLRHGHSNGHILDFGIEDIRLFHFPQPLCWTSRRGFVASGGRASVS